MNKVKILTLLIIVLISSLTIYSRNKEVNKIKEPQKVANAIKPQKEINFKEDNISIKYSCSIINGNLNFTLNIQDDNIGKNINENFIVSTEKSDLPISISNQISIKQKELSQRFSKAEIERIATAMNSLINLETKNIDNKDSKDLRMQGLLMSYSLLKSINRQIMKENGRPKSLDDEYYDATIYTSNTVYEGFNRELSAFALIEDLIINVSDFIDYINHDLQYSEQKGVLFLLAIFDNLNTEYISIYELEEEIRTYTLLHPEEFEGEEDPTTLFRWPQGSDHGCCGNYNGPC
ncbi:MAG: hypothetical protein LBI45_08600 [Bacteroidales bacterium]|jgi:hypothetical protein|nr:hypothetical protein [Bacteroidales bacterium]